MPSRGETDFVRLPPFAAGLYDRMLRGRGPDSHYADLAKDLLAQGARGRLLDVGTGPGRLLVELRAAAPSLELHGLDISPAMVALARRTLGSGAELRVGSIAGTDYPAASFDVVTCSGSFYLWDEPQAGLAEVHRLLAPGGAAHLYESTRDYDRPALKAALARNLAGERLVRRLLAPRFLERQLAMTYTAEEVRGIVARTPFAGRCSITPLTLGGLPVWMRVTLRR